MTVIIISYIKIFQSIFKYKYLSVLKITLIIKFIAHSKINFILLVLRDIDQIYCTGLSSNKGLDVQTFNDWSSDSDSTYASITPDDFDFKCWNLTI